MFFFGLIVVRFGERSWFFRVKGGDLAVGAEVADEGVFGEEVEVVLLFFWVFEVVAEVTQAVVAVARV